MKKRKRKKLQSVCFMIPDFGSGGAQRVMANLMNSFAKAGYRVCLFCFQPEPIESFYELDPKIEFYTLPPDYKKKRRNILKCAHITRRVLKDINPDIIIPFLIPVNLYSFFATRFTKIRFICSERNDPKSAIRYPEWLYIRNYVFRHADGCVFQTRDAMEYFGRRVARHSSIIENPMILNNTDDTVIKAEDREKRIVCVARYDPQKNHAMMINAFSRFHEKHPDYVLEIYGRDFNYQSTMEDMIKKHKMDNHIKIMGPRHHIHDTIYRASISVLPSNWEGMPNALLESVALGVPSIATDCPIGGARQIIEDGVNGYLIPVGDEDALVDRMNTLVECPMIADTFSVNGRKIRDRFDAKKIYKQWLELIDRTTDLSL